MHNCLQSLPKPINLLHFHLQDMTKVFYGMNLRATGNSFRFHYSHVVTAVDNTASECSIQPM